MYKLEVEEGFVREDLKDSDLYIGDVVKSNNTGRVYLVASTELINLENPMRSYHRNMARDSWSFRRFPKGTVLTITI